MKNKTYLEKEENLLKEYNQLKPGLIEWGKFLINHIPKYLEELGYDVKRIQIGPIMRVKPNKSVISNAFYRGTIQSSKPLMRIEDKVGIRIVVPSTKDVVLIKEKLCHFNKQVYDIRISRRLDKHLKTPKVFDYRSLHMNLTPSKNFDSFEKVDLGKRKYYTCELQVRTLLQHAFAEIAHDTIYKGPYGADGSLVRLLSRGNALMEVTDEHFDNAYDIMENEETLELSFTKSLISIANDKLDDAKFSEFEVDSTLTSMIYQDLGLDEDISKVEKTLVMEKKLIEKTLNKFKAYLRYQPVIIYIIHLLITKTDKVIRSWTLDDEILNELTFYLGISDRK
ncbi:MAG: hypothetical protein GYB31_10920 [Bacteroidetes bacterium]|nr:hypothetical protein [Bacteroidota bacterium]